MSRTKSDVDSKRDPQIQKLVDQLGSSDPRERMESRTELVAIGEPAVDEIVEAFGSDRQQTRWEAANCLRRIGSERAIPALVTEIEEANTDVGWLAAEGLIAIGEKSLIPVLTSLTSTDHPEIDHFYQHAHHIIRTFACYKKYHIGLQGLLTAFDQSQPQMGVPRAAYEVLQQLEDSSTN
jgi:hypothetical protein